MGSFDDNIPLTRITPTKPWDRRLPRRKLPEQETNPTPEPAKLPDRKPPDTDSGDGHIDEYD